MLWQKVGNGNLSLRNISDRVASVLAVGKYCKAELSEII